MKTREALKQEYKDRPPQVGVLRITNGANGKVLLAGSMNLDGKLNRHRFLLDAGMHANAALQEDWKKFGADSFTFEVLERVQIKDDPGFNLEDALTLLEEIWIEKVQPFGDRGYNLEGRVRE